MNKSSIGFVGNVEEMTLSNSFFRHVIFTANHSQLVLMCLQPGEEIGVEVHNVDQFFRIESGTGKVVMNGESLDVQDGVAIVVPAGTQHNVVNTGSTEMKLYTIYSPAQHPDGTVHKTKEEAMHEED